MAGLPGFASHGRSLHLGAGCQQWKLLDVLGTQPSLSVVVVNYILIAIRGINDKIFTCMYLKI